MSLTISNIPGFLHAALREACWYLIFSVTNVCNQRCRMCFNRELDNPADDILTLDEIRRIAAGFDGLFQLTLSGGEPVLRPDLPEIVAAFCARRPVPRITLPSNGQLPELLLTTANRLASENPASTINVALSLDGIGARHDDIRGVSGAFARFHESLEGLLRLKERHRNLTVVVASTVSSFNQDDLDGLLAFIAQSSDPRMFGLMLARGRTREPHAVEVDRERFIAALERLHKIQQPLFARGERAWQTVYLRNRTATIRSRRMADPCRAGSKLLVLTHNGFLWPCEPLQSGTHDGQETLESGFCFGNLRSAGYDAGRLLASDHGREIMTFIRNRKCACTFECALLNNFALNPLNCLRAMKEWL